MADNPHIARVYDEASEIKEQEALVRKIIDEVCDALKAPMPDTFLGRKTQEPFPKQQGNWERSSSSNAREGR
jgi:hypothetical protein